MTRTEKLRKKFNDYLFDHIRIRSTLSHSWCALLALVSAFIYAFGFTCFISTSVEGGMTLVSGGVAGLSQNIILIIDLAGGNVDHYTMQSILYFAFNIPIIIFGFICVGKKFTIYSIVNVVAASVLISVLPMTGITEAIQTSPFIENSVITRALFAGMCTGTSAAIAFRGEFSCGGMDIITYYFALRKSTSVGKYMMLVNGIIIVLYTILLLCFPNPDWATALLSIFFSISMLFVSSLLIDLINVRNKKVQLQVITSNDYLAEILISYFPHGATTLEGKGVYSHADRHVIYMVVSTSEVKKVSQVAKQVDQHVFIAATPLNQVYGSFFIKPVE